MTGNRPQKWEVWLADVKFEDKNESKRRPVIVIDDREVYFLSYKVTGQQPKGYGKEYTLANWEEAGLDTVSTVILDKFIRLENDKFVGRIGQLARKDIMMIKALTIS